MIILDTNVVSELLRTRPDTNIFNWVARQEPLDLFLSAVSEAELRYGVQVLPAGQRRDRLAAGIEDMLGEEFAGRILPFDSGAARMYAVIAATRRIAGRPISLADGQIAAIARSRGALIATRDTGGFDGCEIEVINPWTDR